jgi:hypothetical protein
MVNPGQNVVQSIDITIAKRKSADTVLTWLKLTTVRLRTARR